MGQVQGSEGALICIRPGKTLPVFKDKPPVFIKVYCFTHIDVLSGLSACNIPRRYILK